MDESMEEIERKYDREEGMRKVRGLVSHIQGKMNDPDVALDTPSWVCWAVIVDTFKMFEELTGREPTKIYLPRTVEILMSAYMQKEISTSLSLRERGQIWGCEIVFDAREFDLK